MKPRRAALIIAVAVLAFGAGLYFQTHRQAVIAGHVLDLRAVATGMELVGLLIAVFGTLYLYARRTKPNN